MLAPLHAPLCPCPGLCSGDDTTGEPHLRASWSQCLCVIVQARLWQVGKLMPQKLARHMEVRGVPQNPFSVSYLSSAAFQADQSRPGQMQDANHRELAEIAILLHSHFCHTERSGRRLQPVRTTRMCV